MKIEATPHGLARAHEDQRNFRLLLEAVAYPGRIVTFPEPGRPFAQRRTAHVIVLETLADMSTPVWIDGDFPEARSVARDSRWPVGAMESCVFALCRGDRLSSLDRFSQGTQLDPHLSTTAIVEMTGLFGGDPLRLAGPGVAPDGQIFAPRSLPEDFQQA